MASKAHENSEDTTVAEKSSPAEAKSIEGSLAPSDAKERFSAARMKAHEGVNKLRESFASKRTRDRDEVMLDNARKVKATSESFGVILPCFK